jgi:hypothetical protein
MNARIPTGTAARSAASAASKGATRPKVSEMDPALFDGRGHGYVPPETLRG